MDVTKLLRRTHCIAPRRAARRREKIFVALTAVLVLASACSTLPPEYDPVTQAGNAKRSVMGWFGYDEPAPPNVQPPPAQGRPIPNLATVPPPPYVTAGQRQQRQKELAALQADQAAAAKADAALRAQNGAQVPPRPGAPGSPPAPPALPPAPTPAAPPAGAATEPPSTNANTAPFSPNSLPLELLNSTPDGAGPAPVIELPAPPDSGGMAAARVLTTSERHGTVSFASNTASVSAAGRNTLDTAAAAAIENDGRVRLVPAPSDGAAAAPGLVDQRAKALREALAGTGLPADRVTIGEAGARRVDAYDVFVDY
jgi:outer membrane protein OmpA-like peptidoglycan-associated protein